MAPARQWVEVRKEGLYCLAAQCYIDPSSAVECAIITHAHADHAVFGHKKVIAHPDTHALMQIRYGEEYTCNIVSLNYFEKIQVNKAEIYLLPAGHILGSSQIVISHGGERLIISGDYKRTFDPTCEPFISEPCDVFITEATFGLPVFKHPPIEQEIQKLVVSLATFPERCHLIGVYALGKCQRLIKVLRILGYQDPIYLHGRLKKFCEFYQNKGINLGSLKPASELDLNSSKGALVLCPPSALHDKWSRRFANVLVGMASGWMQIRARAKQKRVELPLIISDHADWAELTQTILEVNPKEVWVTHGREEALVYFAQREGYQAQELHLLEHDTED
ncbi:ligase-associated DNA damage response exonuclease [Legionella rowbothamii]|uniref:ligase-associated DNA damage response exonuclease n=1 Tax=Legionella rowbothamii TaxID=96229 RepID=UPI001055B0F1|nr:ligase-associated DNA damage response exonuclease [Legionella rowbothamii]